MPRTARKPAAPAPAAKATGHKAPRKGGVDAAAIDASVRPRRRRGETVTKPDAAAKKAGLSPLYATAIRGDAEAIAELKAMTPADRAAICPPGLSGLARKRFINEGMTGAEQRAEAQGKRLAAEAAEEKAAKAAARKAARKGTTDTDTDTTEENEMPATTTRKPRTRKADAGPADLTAKLNAAITPKGKTTRKAPAATDGFTAAQVAKDAGIDARKFRGFLRTKGIARQFPNKAAAAKAVKAFKAAQ